MSEEGGAWSKSQARRRRRQRNVVDRNSIKNENKNENNTIETPNMESCVQSHEILDNKVIDKNEKLISEQNSNTSLEKINKNSSKIIKQKTTKEIIPELKGNNSKIDKNDTKLEVKVQCVSEKKSLNLNKSVEETKPQQPNEDQKEESDGKTNNKQNNKKRNKKKNKQVHENIESQGHSIPNIINEKKTIETISENEKITKKETKNIKSENGNDSNVKQAKLKRHKNNKVQNVKSTTVEDNLSKEKTTLKNDSEHYGDEVKESEKITEEEIQGLEKGPEVVQSGLGSEDLDPHYTSLCSSLTVQSETAGFFSVILETIEAAAGEEWILNRFNKCQSDIERIQTMHTNEKVKKCLDNTLSHVTSLYRKKSLKESRARRLAGDEALKRDDVRAALALYSQAVLRAPNPADEDNQNDEDLDKGVELAMAYGKRSEALLIEGHYQLCLRDIHNALSLPYPTDQKYLLVWRMGRCWRDWGFPTKARSAMLLADQLLKNAPPGFIVEMDQPRLQEEIVSLEQFRDMSDQIEKEFNPEEEDRPLPNLTGGGQTKLANASAKLEVYDTRSEGRFLVTKEEILPGDILIAQPALASSLLYEKQGTHCYRCFSRLVAAEPCPRCAGVAFCSRRCARLADDWHRWECRHGELLRGSGLSPLARLALSLVAGYTPIELLPGHRVSSLETALGLCAHETRRDSRDHLQRCVMAELLTAILQNAGYFQQQDDELFESLNNLKDNCSAVLTRLLQVLQFNAHEVCETVRPADGSFRGSKVEYLGVAVYPTASLFNHDCHPALSRYFVGTSIVLEAIRSLPGNGCPVPENYGPVYYKRNVAWRQRVLASRYWFRCRCQSCTDDWPLFAGMPPDDIIRFRCPINDKCPAKLLPQAKKCHQCRRQVDFTESNLLLKRAEDDYQQALSEMDIGNVEEAHRLLCNYISIFYRLVYPPRREVQLAQIALASCAAAKGNTRFIKEDS